MNIHEYQAKEIFRSYGVPTPGGVMATTPEEARRAAEQIGGEHWVVKAQIHAGGRGKGGGVKFADSVDEVERLSRQMLGMTLVTHQTGPEGKVVRKILVTPDTTILHEYYLGVVLDRARETTVMVASAEGGVEIETIAAEAPDKLIRVLIDPIIGFRPHHARELAFGLQLTGSQSKQFAVFAEALYRAYKEKDASLVEINPLILTEGDKFLALDAKMNFDDNALFRHPDVVAMRDLHEEKPSEIEAGRYKLSYIKLDGNVGCMVNGAGLAMSTMDIIKLEGGDPANFLDVGGGASAETVAKGFEIILRDPSVKAIFVNIFGGIVRCDRIARGILEATETIHVNVPVIVRLDGTNHEQAAEILRTADIENIIIAVDLADGARKAVNAAKGA